MKNLISIVAAVIITAFLFNNSPVESQSFALKRLQNLSGEQFEKLVLLLDDLEIEDETPNLPHRLRWRGRDVMTCATSGDSRNLRRLGKAIVVDNTWDNQAQEVIGENTELWLRGNLRIINGTGYTYSKNGLGNLIIGYNSDPDVGGVWKDRSGSHNVIIGDRHTYGGNVNLIHGDCNYTNRNATVLFGTENGADAGSVSILGGRRNFVEGWGSVIVGGQDNVESATWNVIVGN